MELHIGEKIRKVFEGQQKKKGLTVVEFAKQLSTGRQNIYRIFERKSIDTDQLRKISRILQHDFFQYFSRDYKAFELSKELMEIERILEIKEGENKLLKAENSKLWALNSQLISKKK